MEENPSASSPPPVAVSISDPSASLCMDEKPSASSLQPVVVSISDPSASLCTDETLKAKKATKGRLCDCKNVDNDWAVKLHNAMIKLTKNVANIKEIVSAVYRFEYCKYCVDNDYERCEKPTRCQDFIKLLRKIQPHYSGLRSLIRKIYEIRRLVRWLEEIDWVVASGDWIQFLRLTKHHISSKGVIRASRDEMDRINMDENFRKHFLIIENDFKKACRKWPKHECHVCRVLCDKVTPVSYPNGFKVTESTNVLIAHFAEKGWSCENPANTCNKCLSSLKIGVIPKFSELNNFFIDEVPEEIKCLNMYEMQLIQLSKTFQTIYRLKNMRSKGPTGDNIQGIKGDKC